MFEQHNEYRANLHGLQQLDYAAMINLVVNCSNRKSVIPQPEHCLRNLRPGALEEISGAWHRSLNASTDKIEASKLYIGEYWSIVRRVAELNSVNTLVFSAGLGLIPYQAKIPSYSATYSNGSPDSINNLNPKDRSIKQTWFELSLNHSKFGLTLSQLKTILNATTTLFAVSRPYLSAIKNTLHEIKSSKIIFLGSNLRNLQLKNIIEIPGSLRMILGGSLQTVSIRLVEHLLTQTSLLHNPNLTVSDLESELNRLNSNPMLLPKFNRAKSTDADVLNFLRSRSRLKDSHSRALRDFRDSGNACEQSRFKKLYLSISEEI